MEPNTALLIVVMTMIGVLGYTLNKRWESVDDGIVEIRAELKEHNNKSETTHSDLYNKQGELRDRISRMEGQQED